MRSDFRGRRALSSFGPSVQPNSEKRISVCMATYNGSRFVDAQIRSILIQLGRGDELVIVDDASTDDTVEVISAIGDPRIRIVRAVVNSGHVRTFERALSLAEGRYVMLADQDDLWPLGRVDLMIGALEKATFAVGNHSEVSDVVGRLRPHLDVQRWRNIIGLATGRREYFGCAMGMRHEFLRLVLPFPRGIQAHDHWLAILGNVDGRIAHLDDVLVERTVHESNLTPQRRRGWSRVLRTRVIMLKMTAAAVQRSYRLRNA